jgi:hypothetical protein
VANLFRDDAVNTFADGNDLDDLHITQVGFGGDVLLQPRTERLAEEISERGE